MSRLDDATWQAVIAVVLSGLGPGAGHLHVGHPLRGVAWLVVIAATSLLWIGRVTVSYQQATLWALPPLLAVLGCIVDSGWVARRDVIDRRWWNRWWFLVLVIAMTGFLAPGALFALTSQRAGLVSQPDSAMEPTLTRGSWLVVDRHAHRDDPPTVGDLVVIRPSADDRPTVRRVHPRTLGTTRSGEDLLVIGDAAVSSREAELVSLDALEGEARYVVLPAPRNDWIRYGEDLR
ncbi:MAG: S26 family signal peptidase [Acidobacteriota bacterium]